MKIPEKYTGKMSRLDALAHSFHDVCMAGEFRKSGLFCPMCGRPLTFAYHEERLYSVHCKTCETITLTTASCPEQAARFAGGYRHEKP